MRKYNVDIIKDLKNAALDAVKNEHYLQAAVIIFQTVEVLLRIKISAIARSKGIDKDVEKVIADKEQSFYKLVLYLNLLDPKSALLKRLYSFNNKRNEIIHNLFEKFADINQYKKTLDEICLEGVRLNEELRKSIGIDK